MKRERERERGECKQSFSFFLTISRPLVPEALTAHDAILSTCSASENY